MTTTALRVRNWDANFENHQTRRLKAMSWVPVPNSHDGLGYARLLEHENGVSHLGAWLALLQVASKTPERGLLARSSGLPYGPEELQSMTRVPAEVFAEAIPRLLEIGWLERGTTAESRGTPRGQSGTPRDPRGTPRLKGREGKGRTTDCTEQPSSSSAPPAIPESLREFTEWHPHRWSAAQRAAGARLSGQWEARLAEWTRDYPGVDVVGVLRKGHRWWLDHPKRRKSAGKLFTWLESVWLTRAQDERTNGRDVVPKHDARHPQVPDGTVGFPPGYTVSVAFPDCRRSVVLGFGGYGFRQGTSDDLPKLWEWEEQYRGPDTPAKLVPRDRWATVSG